MTFYKMSSEDFKKGILRALENGKRIMALFENDDEKVFIHELAHIYFVDAEEIAEFSDELKNNLYEVNKWGKWKQGDYREFEGRQWEEEFKLREQEIIAAIESGDTILENKLKKEWIHEKFAVEFEKYLVEGKSHNPILQRMFDNFKRYVNKVYDGYIYLGKHPQKKISLIMEKINDSC